MAASIAPVTPPKPALLPGLVSLLQSLQDLTLEKDYVPARLPEGKVVGIWGEAIIRLPDGEVRELRIGDMVRKGHVIMTSQNGIVQLEVEGTRYARLPVREMEPPIAGISGGEDGALNDAQRVIRIVEIVDPASYDFTSSSLAGLPPLGGLDVQPPALQPSADQTVNEGTGTVTVTITLSSASAQTVTVDYRTVDGS
ncbi:MAG: hypothetical protein QG612_2161, partial [Pseudomonadota bacterium]|nr:hypothetical protein [Pseudomonadota bacterium]